MSFWHTRKNIQGNDGARQQLSSLKIRSLVRLILPREIPIQMTNLGLADVEYAAPPVLSPPQSVSQPHNHCLSTCRRCTFHQPLRPQLTLLLRWRSISIRKRVDSRPSNKPFGRLTLMKRMSFCLFRSLYLYFWKLLTCSTDYPNHFKNREAPSNEQTATRSHGKIFSFYLIPLEKLSSKILRRRIRAEFDWEILGYLSVYFIKIRCTCKYKRD